MQRAKTVTGLFLQYVRSRWGGLGRGGKLFLIGGLVLAAVASFQLGACLFGACGASPCSAGRQSPCHLASQNDEPCPYAAARADEPAEPPADHPPCH